MEGHKRSDVTFQVKGSRRQAIYVKQVTKTALTSNDTKRFILEDGIHTRAIGHMLNIPYAQLKREKQNQENVNPNINNMDESS